MKKLLTLLFILLLFTSCEKEVEKPKDNAPKINEEKIIEPIKPEIVEPEVVEPETTDIEEIVLPEADENTVTITIDFPEDFPETPYTEPELVSPEEFEWGEYATFVRYPSYRYSNAGDSVYSYAILSNDANSIAKGKDLYDLFNQKYLIENDVDYSFLERYADKESALFEGFKKSNLIYISENAKDVCRFYLTKSQNQKSSNSTISSTLFDFYIDFFKNGEVVFEEIRKEEILYGMPPWIYLSNQQYEYPEAQTKYKLPESIKGDIYYRDSENVVYTDFRVPSFYSVGDIPESINWYVFSIKENRVIYSVNLPSLRKENVEDVWGEISQIISDRYLVINFNKAIMNEGFIKDFYFSTYLFDIKNESLTLLESYCEGALVSPDVRYIAYTDNTDAEIVSGINNLENQKDGIYIKNLTNNETVFLECSGHCYVMNFINKDMLLQEIGK